MLKDMITWEGLTFLAFGIVVGVLYYNFVLEPRDEKHYAVMDCMDDLRSKAEYDRCVQQVRN